MISNGKGSIGCKESLELSLPIGSSPPLLRFFEVYRPRPGGFHFSFLFPTPLQATESSPQALFTERFRMTKILNKDRVKSRQDQ